MVPSGLLPENPSPKASENPPKVLSWSPSNVLSGNFTAVFATNVPQDPSENPPEITYRIPSEALLGAGILSGNPPRANYVNLPEVFPYPQNPQKAFVVESPEELHAIIARRHSWTNSQLIFKGFSGVLQDQDVSWGSQVCFC